MSVAIITSDWPDIWQEGFADDTLNTSGGACTLKKLQHLCLGTRHKADRVSPHDKCRVAQKSTSDLVGTIFAVKI